MATKNEYDFLAKVQKELGGNPSVTFKAISGYGRINPIQGIFEDNVGDFYDISPDSDWVEMNRILLQVLKVSKVELDFFNKSITIYK